MFKKNIIIIFSIQILLSGCVWYSPKRLCNFPIQEIDDIEITGELTPKPLFMDVNVNSFAVIDTFLLSYNVRGSNFVSVYSINTGEEIGVYCRHGRGPDEILSMMPFFQPDCRADSMVIFDASRSLMRFWDLKSSVAEQGDVFSQGFHLNKDNGALFMSAMSLPTPGQNGSWIISGCCMSGIA